MTWWLILAIWLVGWYYGARLALAWRMNKLVCSRDNEFLSICRGYDGPGCAKPLGAVRARGLPDGLAALAIGLAWPVLLLARGLVATTPPTDVEARRIATEQARRIEVQATEIARLEREISGRGGL